MQSVSSETAELSIFRRAVAERLTSRVSHILGVSRMVDHHAHVVQQRESLYWKDARRVRTAVSFIRELRPPWFMQVHLLDTHCCSWNPETPFVGELGAGDERGRFDGEIREADQNIEKIISSLRAGKTH